MDAGPARIYLERAMRPTLLAASCLLLAVPLAVACSQRVTPEEEYSEEERDRPLVDPSRLPPGVAGGAGAPAGAPMQAPASEAPAADAVRGTVSLPEGADAAGGAVFVFVRSPGVAGGPPLAVQRHPASALPLDYAIGSESMMMGGGALPDEVVVEARLDADGDAMTTGPDDWSARSQPVAVGSEGVDLLLSRS